VISWHISLFHDVLYGRLNPLTILILSIILVSARFSMFIRLPTQ
jgi:hypothetical protein